MQVVPAPETCNFCSTSPVPSLTKGCRQKAVEPVEPKDKRSRTFSRQLENGMRPRRKLRRIVLGLSLYVAFCTLCGIYLADGALHPRRRLLSENEIVAIRDAAQDLSATFEDASVTTADGITLRGWTLRPGTGNGNAVILLHGVADNRLGMIGYAQLLSPTATPCCSPTPARMGSAAVTSRPTVYSNEATFISG